MSESKSRADIKPLSLLLLARQIAEYAPATFLPAFIGLLSSAIFTRVFSPEEYGQYSLTMSIATLLTSIAVQWVQQGVNRYLPAAAHTEDERRIKTALVLALVIVETAILLTGILVLNFVGEYAFSVPALVFVALSVVYGPAGVAFQAEMRGAHYSIFHILDSTLKFFFSLALVLAVSTHPSMLIWGGVLSLAILIPFIYRNAGLPSPFQVIQVDDSRVRYFFVKLAKYGLPMAGWFLASTLLGVGDRYVIQWSRGPAEVGIYSANYQLISGAIGLVTAPVLLAAHPFLMRAWGQGDTEQTEEWIGRIIELLIILGVGAVAVTMLVSADLARWLLGPEFRVGHSVMPIVLLGAVVWNIAMYLHKPLEFLERTTAMLALGLGAAVLNLVLNVAFVPRIGYTAAAWTTVASYAFYAIVAGIVGRRRISWRVRWLLLARVGLGAVALIVAGGWLRRIGSATLGYWGGIVGVFVVVALFGTGLFGLVWKAIVLPMRHADGPTRTR